MSKAHQTPPLVAQRPPSWRERKGWALRLCVFLTFERHAAGGTLDHQRLSAAITEVAERLDLPLAHKLRRAATLWQHQAVDLDRVMHIVDEIISALESGQETR